MKEAQARRLTFPSVCVCVCMGRGRVVSLSLQFSAEERVDAHINGKKTPRTSAILCFNWCPITLVPGLSSLEAFPCAKLDFTE